LVRFFVASHIKRKIDVVLRALRIEAIMIATDSDKRKRRMNSVIKQLEEVKLTAFSKRRRLILILQTSSFPLLLTVLVSVSAQIIGIKLSNSSDVLKILKGVASLTDFSKVLDTL